MKQPPKLASSVIPLHHQLYLSLRQRLLENAFPIDSPLPGEMRLAEEFGVSRVTLRRTLDTLQSEGLIVRKHGVGTFATRRIAADAKKETKSYSEHVYSTSRQFRHELLEFGYVPTPHFLDPAEERFGPVVLKTVRVSYDRKIPAHLIVGYTPARLGHLIDRETLSNHPLMNILQQNGVVIDQTQLLISASAADASEAAKLEVPIGSPLIRSDRISTENGRPVDHDLILSRPDTFRYSFISDENGGTLRPGSPG